jgi:antitoxin component YwqK of YwqJK toxin-antitoxin module
MVKNHENRQKEKEATYKDGKQDGLATTWYENGQKWSEATYKDGKVEGLMTGWYDTGQKAIEATYKDGKKVSETTSDEEGNEIKK